MLELELTESTAMENFAFTIDSMNRMHQLGVGLSIDDFGTGYSSLSYLKHFRVNKIKIDQSFVQNLATDKDDAAIVRAIINLSHNLGFKVIAEGVETAGQLEFLRRQGCDEIQGFYFRRPGTGRRDRADPAYRCRRKGRSRIAAAIPAAAHAAAAAVDLPGR